MSWGVATQNGVSVSLASIVSLSCGATEFSPAALFTSGVQGAWYDPSDYTTLFQDSAGTTPVTAVEQPVGLMLDKSQGLVLGSELVTNGDFSGGSTGWTADASVSFTGGAAVFTASAGGAGIAQTISVPAGAFTCSFTVSGASSGGLTFRIRTAGGTIHATFSTENTALNKTYSFVLSPASASNRLEIISPGGAGSPTTLTLDNVTIKSLAGNHALQATAASRPVLRARYNILLATDTLATQSVTTLATTYKLSFTGAGTITLSGTATGTYSAGTNTITCTAGTLTLTVSGTVTNADLRLSSTSITMPAYQSVVTSTNYVTTGFLPYLSLDGVDDSYGTSSINFTATDKMSVVAGVTKIATGFFSVIAELSTSVSTNNGSFVLLGPDGTVPDYGFANKGTVSAEANVNGYESPITNVVSGLGDINGSTSTLRVNGAQVAQTTTSQGTGNYGTYAMYVGRRANSSLPFGGNIYQMVICGKALSAAELASTEAYVNARTGAY